jgi:hypothetical protein
MTDLTNSYDHVISSALRTVGIEQDASRGTCPRGSAAIAERGTFDGSPFDY